MLSSLIAEEPAPTRHDDRVGEAAPHLSLDFVDLFAGLGGFHQALAGLGHTCAFASEIDPTLRDVYELNFGIKPNGDIRDCYEDVPKHDVLCAGFPCQPFSKAGEQLGFSCPQWGDLFEYVLSVINRHKPRYLMIENVPHLMKHDDGRTWTQIERKLRAGGYDISARKLSPHMFGVPQRRERAILVGCRDGLEHFIWPESTHSKDDLTMDGILDCRPRNARQLPSRHVEYLDAWQALLSNLPSDAAISAFPIWAMEFGADYPLEGKVPLARTLSSLADYRGAFGQPLRAKTRAAMAELLPQYARLPRGTFPKWKHAYIEQNRAFYRKYQKEIDAWLPSIRDFPASFQKLEWNWKEGERVIERGLVQFRASGIRVRRPTSAPSLVAITESQVPIIPWEGRYMTIQECARLQSMGNLKHFPRSENDAFKALGNAVNVTVIQKVAQALIRPH